MLRQHVATAADDAATRVIIRFAPGARHGLRTRLRANGITVRHDFTAIGAVSGRLSARMLRMLERDKDVLSISYDSDVTASGVSSTITGTALGTPYSLRSTIGLDPVLTEGALTGAGVTVAVIDSGLLQDGGGDDPHPDDARLHRRQRQPAGTSRRSTPTGTARTWPA